CRGDDKAAVEVRREGRHAHSSCGNGRRRRDRIWKRGCYAGGSDIGCRSKRRGLNTAQNRAFTNTADAKLAQAQNGEPWCELPVERAAELGKVVIVVQAYIVVDRGGEGAEQGGGRRKQVGRTAGTYARIRRPDYRITKSCRRRSWVIGLNKGYR